MPGTRDKDQIFMFFLILRDPDTSTRKSNIIVVTIYPNVISPFLVTRIIILDPTIYWSRETHPMQSDSVFDSKKVEEDILSKGELKS